MAHNWHAIIGPNGMCECGVRDDGTVVTCADLLAEEHAEVARLQQGLRALVAKWRQWGVVQCSDEIDVLLAAAASRPHPARTEEP